MRQQTKRYIKKKSKSRKKRGGAGWARNSTPMASSSSYRTPEATYHSNSYGGRSMTSTNSGSYRVAPTGQYQYYSPGGMAGRYAQNGNVGAAEALMGLRERPSDTWPAAKALYQMKHSNA